MTSKFAWWFLVRIGFLVVARHRVLYWAIIGSNFKYEYFLKIYVFHRIVFFATLKCCLASLIHSFTLVTATNDKTHFITLLDRAIAETKVE